MVVGVRVSGGVETGEEVINGGVEEDGEEEIMEGGEVEVVVTGGEEEDRISPLLKQAFLVLVWTASPRISRTWRPSSRPLHVPT